MRTYVTFIRMDHRFYYCPLYNNCFNRSIYQWTNKWMKKIERRRQPIGTNDCLRKGMNRTWNSWIFQLSRAHVSTKMPMFECFVCTDVGGDDSKIWIEMPVPTDGDTRRWGEFHSCSRDLYVRFIQAYRQRRRRRDPVLEDGPRCRYSQILRKSKIFSSEVSEKKQRYSLRLFQILLLMPSNSFVELFNDS